MIEEVERVVKGFEEYFEACRVALTSVASDKWEKVAQICEANASAWDALAEFYKGQDDVE